MSAKLCSRCRRPIVFGKERDTGRIIPLSVGAKVYRVIKDDVVEIDPKALVPHVCAATPVPDPVPERAYSEPQGGQDA